MSDVSIVYKSQVEEEIFEEYKGDTTNSLSRVQEQDSLLLVGNVPASGPIQYLDQTYSFNGLAWSPLRGMIVLTDRGTL